MSRLDILRIFGSLPRPIVLHSRRLACRQFASLPRKDFQYVSAETAEILEKKLAETRDKGMQEYQELKELLLKRTWRFGTFFGLYLFLTVSTEAAFCELLGAGASYGYLLWLFKDVDRLQPGDSIYLKEVENLQPRYAQLFAKWLASYRHALQPRLLVLISLFGAIAAYNSAFPEQPLSLIEEGCLIGGFLSYKVALILKVYDDLKPKILTEEDLLQEPRPMIAPIEDVEFPWKERSKSQDSSDLEK